MRRPLLRTSPRFRGHDVPPLRAALDDLLRKLPRPLWPAPYLARIGMQAGSGVTTHRVAVPGLHAPLVVAFASDFHAGPLTADSHLLQTVVTLAAMRADVLLLGGDFVSGRAAWAKPLIDALAALRPPLGSYAVLGNHDLWSDFDELEVMLLTAGVEMLTNRAVTLPAPWDGITLCGVDDDESGLPDPAALAAATGYRLLLLHSPAGIFDLGGAGWDLAVAGHTHAGQIALPGGIPLILPRGEGLRRFAYGRFEPQETGAGTLIVSRGVGYSALPLRLCCPPEVLRIELVPG